MKDTDEHIANEGGAATPNERLAARVTAALDTAGLLPAGRADAIRTGLAAGSLKEEDWRLRLEDVIEQAARGERDGN